MKYGKYDKQQDFRQIFQFFIRTDDIIQRILYQSATDNNNLRQQCHKISEHAEHVISHLETFSSFFPCFTMKENTLFQQYIWQLNKFQRQIVEKTLSFIELTISKLRHNRKKDISKLRPTANRESKEKNSRL